MAKSHPCVIVSLIPLEKRPHVTPHLISASYINIKPRTARLFCFPDNIWSMVTDAFTPESMRISRKPPPPQSWPIDEIKQDCVWKPPSRIVWLLNAAGKCHKTCFAIQYSCWAIVYTENDLPSVFTFMSLFSWLYTLLTYLRVWHILLMHIQPQCEMHVFQRLITGILTKKEW